MCVSAAVHGLRVQAALAVCSAEVLVRGLCVGGIAKQVLMRSSEHSLGVCLCCSAGGSASLLLTAQSVFFCLFVFFSLREISIDA